MNLCFEKKCLNKNSSFKKKKFIYDNTFLSFVILTYLFVFVVTTTRVFNSTDLKCNMRIRGPFGNIFVEYLVGADPLSEFFYIRMITLVS